MSSGLCYFHIVYVATVGIWHKRGGSSFFFFLEIDKSMSSSLNVLIECDITNEDNKFGNMYISA